MSPRSTILAREIDRLKQRILLLGGRVESSLRQAVKAVRERDTALARSVIDTDEEIDQQEVELEEECLKILALHQPVAIDLRFIVAVLKINNDLERVGDLATNIADHAIFLSERPPIAFPFDFEAMAERVQEMLRLSLDALVNQSSSAAQRVRLADDEVDRLHRAAVERVSAAFGARAR